MKKKVYSDFVVYCCGPFRLKISSIGITVSLARRVEVMWWCQ